MNDSSQAKLISAVLRLLLLIGSIVVLYFGKSLLLPLFTGGLLAMLVDPIDSRLRSRGWKKGLSISTAFLVLILFFSGLFLAIGQQSLNFSENWPQTQQKLVKQINELRSSTGLEGVIPKLDSSGQENTGENLLSKLPITGSGVFGFFSSAFGLLGDFLLMLVYVILLLAHKERLREFVLRRMPDSQRGTTHQTINESVDIAQDYLRGRLILIAILTVLYTAGFTIVGLEYALLIALLVAVMSIIPYLGNILGGLFACAMAFAGSGGSDAVIGVVITMSIAQVLESYVLTPLIVGDEVDLNPLFTILGVIGMSIIWGPVGAIIAIPLFAMLRIVCSHVEGLKDYAYLLGQE